MVFSSTLNRLTRIISSPPKTQSMEDISDQVALLKLAWQEERLSLEERGISPWCHCKWEKLGIENGRSSAIKRVLARFPGKIQNDSRFVSEAINNCHPYFLEHLSIQVQDDFEHVRCAVKHHGESLEYASQRLRENEGIISAAIEQSGLALEFVGDTERDNRELVLSAVRQNGLALRYASPRLKKDREVVWEAIQQKDDERSDCVVWKGKTVGAPVEDGMALQFAHAEFWNDEQIVRTALMNGAGGWGLGFKCVSRELQQNPGFVKWAIRENLVGYEHVNIELRKDEELALLAISNDISNLDLVSDDLKQNKKFVLKAVEIWKTLRHVPTHFLKDEDIVKAANL